MEIEKINELIKEISWYYKADNREDQFQKDFNINIIWYISVTSSTIMICYRIQISIAKLDTIWKQQLILY